MQIMAALETAGATPVANRDLHAIAYLANVLSPLWEVDPVEGSVLKDRKGPRSAALERELDACVGLGLIIVDSIQPDDEYPNRLNATFRLNGAMARPVLREISALPDQAAVEKFLTELAFAFAEIVPERRDDAAKVDAAWSNPAVAQGRVVDFAEFVEQTRGNPAYNVAEALQDYAPEGVILTPAEKLVMYVRLLKRRAHG